MLYITGDTHGDFKRFYNNTFNKNDTIIILGDFGGIWTVNNFYNIGSLIIEDDELNSLNSICNFIIILGNHENYDRIYNEFEPIKKFGASMYKVKDNISIIRNGEIMKINNKKFLCIGGASSIDKIHRREGISWWKQEEMNYVEQTAIITKLQKENKFDYVLSHTCPVSIIEKISSKYANDKRDTTSKMLEEVMNMTQFKKWYFGHFHQNRNIDDRFICLYENIIRVGSSIG